MPDPESGNILRQRLWAALLCGSVGLFLWYVVWMRLPGLRVPPVIGYLAAGTFIAAAVTLLLQARGYTRIAMVPAFLLMATLTGIGGWLGFGRGSRSCEGGFGELLFVPAEMVCRVAFGAGAVLTGLGALLMLQTLHKGKIE
jgi:hypothetical protein